jgi:carbon-monoxide dehydrogenase medium subunit
MDYFFAASVDEALKAAQSPGAVFLAGGTNLVPDVLFGRKKPGLAVDISRLKELRFIEERDGRIRIGALATVTDLLESNAVRGGALPLHECAAEFAGPMVRNRATVGGNLLDASPAADLAPPLLALDGRVELLSPEGERSLPLDKFFLDYRKTTVRPGELLTAVSIRPLGGEDRSGYWKLQLRRAMAISVVSVALSLRMEGGRCTEAGIGMGAAASVPYRSAGAENCLRGKIVGEAEIEAAAAAASEEARPIDDLRASGAYRRRMCGVLLRRLLQNAVGISSGTVIA